MNRILVFTGNGKGKTTAAMGMALRATGHGLPVAFCQFVKSRKLFGEVRAFALLPLVRVLVMGEGFIPKPQCPEFIRHRRTAQHAMRWVQTAINSPNYTMVVLDEICAAINKNLVDIPQVEQILGHAPPGKIIVCTGRDAPKFLTDMADTVTQMTCIRHSYQHGISPWPGVEL